MLSFNSPNRISVSLLIAYIPTLSTFQFLAWPLFSIVVAFLKQCQNCISYFFYVFQQTSVHCSPLCQPLISGNHLPDGQHSVVLIFSYYISSCMYRSQQYIFVTEEKILFSRSLNYLESKTSHCSKMFNIFIIHPVKSFMLLLQFPAGNSRF